MGSLLGLNLLFWLFWMISQGQEAHAFQVVVDPGHGGSDWGTTSFEKSHLLLEKDITLKLARQIGYQLIARGMHVFLTRNTDVDVPLANRTAFANRLGADVFISIHMNSKGASSSRDVEGVETFILNNTTDASSRRLARLENSVISTTSPSTPEQLDVALILKDLRLDANLKESKRLACHVQKNLVKARGQSQDTSRKDRGVKQALFHVLLGADMPSILVEAGFLSNSKDRAFLQSSRGLNLISRSIAEAVDEYRAQKGTRKEALALSRCKVN